MVATSIVVVMAIIGGGGWYLLKKALLPLTEISRSLRGYYRAGAFFVIGLFFLLAGNLWAITFVEFHRRWRCRYRRVMVGGETRQRNRGHRWRTGSLLLSGAIK